MCHLPHGLENVKAAMFQIWRRSHGLIGSQMVNETKKDSKEASRKSLEARNDQSYWYQFDARLLEKFGTANGKQYWLKNITRRLRGRFRAHTYFGQAYQVFLRFWGWARQQVWTWGDFLDLVDTLSIGYSQHRVWGWDTNGGSIENVGLSWQHLQMSFGRRWWGNHLKKKNKQTPTPGSPF